MRSFPWADGKSSEFCNDALEIGLIQVKAEFLLTIAKQEIVSWLAIDHHTLLREKKTCSKFVQAEMVAFDLQSEILKK